MISKNTIKFIKSLQIKKFRQENELFIVDGLKSVKECLKSDYEIHSLFYTLDYANEIKQLISNNSIQHQVVSENEMKSISNFENNFSAIAILKMKNEKPFCFPNDEWTLVLDSIQDPGNLGTIIRTAEWFGIKNIVCSLNTVDVYNPKVIAASMGSFLRINMVYKDLESILLNSELPILGAFMNGVNPNEINHKSGILIMGNEANGISNNLEKLCNQKITIPRIGGTESLNVAVATGILLYEIKKI